MRFVQAADGVAPDPSARRPGRGAYLCPDSSCAQAAQSRGGFRRAFRTGVSLNPESIDCIEAWQRNAYTR